MVVVYTVVHETVPDPMTPGRALRKGSTLHLEPDRYPLHAKIVERLKKRGGWTTDEQPKFVPEPVEVPESKEDPQNVVYPHQRELVARLRAERSGG